jgi:hypothetical protein
VPWREQGEAALPRSHRGLGRSERALTALPEGEARPRRRSEAGGGGVTPAIVELIWRDAILRPGSCPLSQVATRGVPATRQTVGYLVSATAHAFILAVTFDPKEPEDAEHHVDDLYTIPRQWVLRKRIIQRRRK